MSYLTLCQVPAGQSGPWTIERREFAAIDMPWPDDPPGLYTVLRHETIGMVMADFPRLVQEMSAILARASGRILIGGLGLGVVVSKVLESQSVTEAVVLEIDQHVADLAWPTYAGDSRATLVIGDALTHDVASLGLFDAAWFDLWPSLNPAYSDERALVRARWTAASAWLGLWGDDLS